MRKSVMRQALAAFAFLVLACAVHPAAAQTVVATAGQTVTTGANGQQILFRDKTSISAGADTKIEIKKAAYNPGTGSGNVVIGVAKGAFRYVTGDQSGSHRIETPLSTLAVRGTVIEGYVTPNGFEVFVLVEGAFDVSTRTADPVPVSKPGTYVVVSPNGSISGPFPLTDTMRGSILASVPTLNLVLDHFNEIVSLGNDPLVRFRDKNDAINGSSFALPPPTSVDPDHDHDNDHGGRDR